MAVSGRFEGTEEEEGTEDTEEAEEAEEDEEEVEDSEGLGGPGVRDDICNLDIPFFLNKEFMFVRFQVPLLYQ
jgi:hypothetical protein